MSIEQNKALPRRFFKSFETNDQAALKDILADDFKTYHPGAPEPISREQLLQTINMYHSAFSDQHYTIEDQIAEGNKVVTRVIWRATHTGDFQGVPATGKQVAVGGTAISYIKDGKIVERWLEMDRMSLMQQLGLVPERDQS